MSLDIKDPLVQMKSRPSIAWRANSVLRAGITYSNVCGVLLCGHLDYYLPPFRAARSVMGG